MTKNWIDEIIEENYALVKVLKNTDSSRIFLYRHNTYSKNIIKRYLKGSDEVYQVLKKYTHPNIANVFDVFKDENGVTVLEEYIDGQTVGEYLNDGLYTEKGVRVIVSYLCDALDFLHSHKIIHKDIKPDNIMIDNKGNVKLIDFNASRVFKINQNQDTNIVGTTGYAAPEQYGINQTDERTDIYAIGVLMNVMLTGKSPEANLYNGKLKKVIVKCTQTIPENRYQDVNALKKAL